jgi:hypothetical protein
VSIPGMYNRSVGFRGLGPLVGRGAKQASSSDMPTHLIDLLESQDPGSSQRTKGATTLLNPRRPSGRCAAPSVNGTEACIDRARGGTRGDQVPPDATARVGFPHGRRIVRGRLTPPGFLCPAIGNKRKVTIICKHGAVEINKQEYLQSRAKVRTTRIFTTRQNREDLS